MVDGASSYGTACRSIYGNDQRFSKWKTGYDAIASCDRTAVRAFAIYNRAINILPCAIKVVVFHLGLGLQDLSPNDCRTDRHAGPRYPISDGLRQHRFLASRYPSIADEKYRITYRQNLSAWRDLGRDWRKSTSRVGDNRQAMAKHRLRQWVGACLHIRVGRGYWRDVRLTATCLRCDSCEWRESTQCGTQRRHCGSARDREVRCCCSVRIRHALQYHFAGASDQQQSLYVWRP